MKSYLSLVKFSHTIFALPFALVGFVLGVHSVSGPVEYGLLLFLVLVCMITMRSAAMAFNRYIDRDIDAKNPRTKDREIPKGVLSVKQVRLFIIANIFIFILATYFINNLCFYLSPIAIIVTLGYSYTKRFTFLCHFVLGAGLALAPIGAYLAVTASFDLIPVLFGLIVFLWVGGFDIIYSLQDDDFDKTNQLYSIPAMIGRENALNVSRGVHLIVVVLLVYVSFLVNTLYPISMQYIHWVGCFIFIGLLAFQHSLVTAKNLSRINLAFFTTNGIASFIYGTLFILDFFV